MNLNMTMEEMFREFEFNERPEEMITEVNGMALPDDYLDFMRLHDGGEGSLGENNYGCFYRLKELGEINEEYDVSNSWPDHIVIGSDMSGQLWAYDAREKNYCQIDSCNTDDDTYYTISGSFEEFLINMDEELK